MANEVKPGTWVRRDDGLIVQVHAWASSAYELAGLDIYGRQSKIGTVYTVIPEAEALAARDAWRKQAVKDGWLREDFYS
jgi:hypothetical protein